MSSGWQQAREALAAANHPEPWADSGPDALT